MNDYWQKQGDEPLFSDLLWSRPENKLHAGKLLIVGGHAHGFASPAEAYTEAEKAGIGTSRVLLPDHLRKQLQQFQGPALHMEFAPSTPSGSFASRSLGELLDVSAWADGVLLAGDFGRNSETAVVLEKLVAQSPNTVVLTKDAVDYFTSNPLPVVTRHRTCLVLTIAQLQKLAQSAKFPKAITFGMDFLQLVDTLHEFTTIYPSQIIVKHLGNIFVAIGGKVSTTRTSDSPEEPWRIATAAHVAVWLIQNPDKPFQAATTALMLAD